MRDRERRTITAVEVRDLAVGMSRAAVSSGQSAGVARPPDVAPHAACRSNRRARSSRPVASRGGRSATPRSAGRGSEALPEIIRLAGADKFDEAYRARAAGAALHSLTIPCSPNSCRAISRPATIDSDPPGAEVFYRPYGRNQAPWRPLGRTPVADVTVPRGLMHWKVQLAGRQDGRRRRSWPFLGTTRLRFTLFPANQVPAGMVRIASSDRPFQRSSRRSNIFQKSTCRTTGLTVTRSPTAPSNGSWTTADTGAPSCGTQPVREKRPDADLSRRRWHTSAT